MTLETIGETPAATFNRIGAVVIRGVIARDEVAILRDGIHTAFAPLDRRAAGRLVRTLSPTMSLRTPELLVPALHPRIIAALTMILEPNYAIIPDFDIQRNLYDFTDTRSKPTKLFGLIGYGWHHDAGAEGRSPYLFDPDYRMVKCGLYLQDDAIEWGGGIEIALGGHRRIGRTGAHQVDYLARRAWQTMKIVMSRRPLELKAGDFVAFDSWLPHRGTRPHHILERADADERRMGCVRLPRDQAKLVIYYDAARRRSARYYMSNSLRRGLIEMQRVRDGKAREAFFADFSGLRHPADYPEPILRLLERNGLAMAQLDGEELERAIALRRDALASALVDNYMEMPA